MPEIDPFESMRSLADLWGRSGNAFLESQQGLFRDVAEKMRTAGGGAAGEVAADTAGLEAARHAFGELWSSATGLSASLAKAMQGGKAPDPMIAEMLAKIFDPKSWVSATSALDEALQKMAEGPRLSDLWNVERKFLAVFTAWVALRRRTLEHNTVTLYDWTHAAGAFAKELN